MDNDLDAEMYDQKKNSRKTLGIRGRLYIGFALISLVFLLTSIVIILKVMDAQQSTNKFIVNDFPSHENSYDLEAQLVSSQMDLNSWVISQNPSFKVEFSDGWKNVEKISKLLDDISSKWSLKNIQTWLNMKPYIIQLKALQMKVMNTNDKAEAVRLMLTESYPLLNKILDVLDGPVSSTGERTGGLIDVQSDQLNQGTNKIVMSLSAISNSVYFLLILGILLSIFIALYTSRAIIAHVNIFRSYSKRIATGDLTQRIRVKDGDEIGQLGNDLNTMTDSLSNITLQITESCHNMVTTLEEVKRAVSMQSTGASEQASSINEITASLEEIEKSSTQTMDKAKSLGEVAERTRERGQLGLEAVEQSIAGMKTVREKVQTIAQTILELSHQTQQVGEITAVVNTLAQQSKMLALNASIEAAKAGEAGKGFAVVAAEVKNLAEQSEQSTTQVQKILEDIRHATEKAVMATEEGTKGVDHGTVLVEQTGEIVRDLSDVIHDATIASQQIEAAIRQEGVGIEQITAGMNEINHVTSSFVSSVKETSEAIENLSNIAKNLKKYVDVYKI